jgi:insulysin
LCHFTPWDDCRVCRNLRFDDARDGLPKQVGPDDLHRNALLDLLLQCGKRDAFHTLRTVEQLGYMVWLTQHSVLSVHAAALIVQSAAFGAAHLEARVEAFVESLLRRLQEMDSDAFASQVPDFLEGSHERAMFLSAK